MDRGTAQRSFSGTPSAPRPGGIGAAPIAGPSRYDIDYDPERIVPPNRRFQSKSTRPHRGAYRSHLPPPRGMSTKSATRFPQYSHKHPQASGSNRSDFRSHATGSNREMMPPRRDAHPQRPPPFTATNYPPIIPSKFPSRGRGFYNARARPPHPTTSRPQYQADSSPDRSQQYVYRGEPYIPSKTASSSPMRFMNSKSTRKRKPDEDEGTMSRMMPSAMSTPRPRKKTARKMASEGLRGAHRVKPVAEPRTGHYLWNGKLYPVSDADDEEEEDDSDDEVTDRARPVLRNAARKRQIPSSSDDPSQSEGSSASVTQFARKTIKTKRPPPPDEELIEISDDEDVKELLQGLSALELATRRLRKQKRLPFLMRNLRSGFLARCRTTGVPCEESTRPSAPILVIYRHVVSADDDMMNFTSEGRVQERKRMMRDWLCPICDIHGKFMTKEMLQYHMKLDHIGVTVSWEGMGGKWKLLLTIPKPSETSSSSEDSDETDDEIVEILNPNAPLTDGLSTTQTGLPLMHSAPSVDNEIIDLSEDADIELPPSPIAKQKFRESSPPRRRMQPTPVKRTTYTSASLRGSLPPRYPTPPPPTNPWGPAAQYPYLPPEQDGVDPVYSCRPGGPRLFDLLNSLPLEEFGVLSWMVIDRDEELFELEDMSDEDKVILALWNRWIMLNRNMFVFKGYVKGVGDFLDKNWQMVHRAAGWRALRTFLLVLMTNRFLTIGEVAELLKYYETKTGMEYWYKDKAPPE